MYNVRCFSDLLAPFDIQLVCALCKYTPGDILRAACAVFVVTWNTLFTKQQIPPPPLPWQLTSVSFYGTWQESHVFWGHSESIPPVVDGECWGPGLRGTLAPFSDVSSKICDFWMTSFVYPAERRYLGMCIFNPIMKRFLLRVTFWDYKRY